jgi:hypothetical protein
LWFVVSHSPSQMDGVYARAMMLNPLSDQESEASNAVKSEIHDPTLCINIYRE